MPRKLTFPLISVTHYYTYRVFNATREREFVSGIFKRSILSTRTMILFNYIYFVISLPILIYRLLVFAAFSIELESNSPRDEDSTPVVFVHVKIGESLDTSL